MKLIFGLGNPGSEYEKTFHNIGNYYVRKFCEEYEIVLDKKLNNCQYWKGIINNEKVIIIQSTNYMNLSGFTLQEAISYFKVLTSDILIIYDDYSFNIGEIKFRTTGSAGGHNGMKDICEKLSTQIFKRLKIGIHDPNHKTMIKDYVLKKIPQEAWEIFNQNINLVKEEIKKFISTQ